MNILSRILVVYDTKYGNTKLVAEKIVEGISKLKRTETTLANIKEVDVNKYQITTRS